MEPAPEWTTEVEEALADVVATVRAAGRNAEAQPFWRFLQQGGRLPSGRPLRAVLAGPRVYERAEDDVRLAPDFVGAPPLKCASVVLEHIAALTVQGEVLCTERPREGLFPVRLPWPAAAVSCGRRSADSGCFAVALRRGGGSVRQWRLGNRDGVVETPKEVSGLPTDDPIVAVQAGTRFTVALTARGFAYVWGDGSLGCYLYFGLGARNRAAVRLTGLSGHRIRRFACSCDGIWAESREGELLYLSIDEPLVRMEVTKVAFPLRYMAAAGATGLDVVDAVGRLWWINDPQIRQCYECPVPAKIVAFATDEFTIALAEDGELWEKVLWPNWRNISAGRPELRGMLPYGGTDTDDRIILLPDTSCGKSRLRLFARIAVRLQLPCDPLRVALVPAAVEGCYIVGSEEDPFRWPRPDGSHRRGGGGDTAAAAAAAGY